MASKKFTGKMCVYCAEKRATSADHVVCREFFPVEVRGGLPKAPACDACNHEKSVLEHQFTSVLPFGSDHPTALPGQVEVLRRRLAQNVRLREELARELDLSGMALPLRGGEFTELCRLIVRGLVWHEWKHILPRDYLVEVFTLPVESFKLFDATVLSLGPKNRRERTFASGGLWYRCSRAGDDPGLTTWHLRLYGRLGIAGAEPEGKLERLEIVGITCPPELAGAVERLKRRKTRQGIRHKLARIWRRLFHRWDNSESAASKRQFSAN